MTFADLVKIFQWDYPGFRAGPKSNDWCYIKKKIINLKHRDKGENQAEMEVEIGVVHLWTKDGWSHQTLGEKHETEAPSEPPFSHADILTFDL